MTVSEIFEGLVVGKTWGIVLRVLDEDYWLKWPGLTPYEDPALKALVGRKIRFRGKAYGRVIYVEATGEKNEGPPSIEIIYDGAPVEKIEAGPTQVGAAGTVPEAVGVPEQGRLVGPAATTTWSAPKILPPRRQNSRWVLDDIRGKKLLVGQQLACYEALFEIGPATAGEVNAKLLEATPTLVSPGFHKRLPELERKGVVRRIGAKECRETGRRVASWDVTDRLPRAPRNRMVVTKNILACGESISEACRALVEPLGWKVGEIAVDLEGRGRFHWTARIGVDGEALEAAGWRVAGGYVVGWLR